MEATTIQGLPEGCSICGGTTKIRHADGESEWCTCAGREAAKRELPSELVRWISLAHTIGPLVTPRFSMLYKNLRIVGKWNTIAPHIATVLAGKIWMDFPKPFKVKIMTDEQILRVLLGKDSEISIEEYLKPYSLLIVRVGFLTCAKNPFQDAFSVILKTCNEIMHLPVWFLDDPQKRFERGHWSWSKEASDYLADVYQEVQI